MRDLRIHILIAGFLLSLWDAAGQKPTFEIPDYTVVHYTDENGLPQNSIKGICADSSGYIWLATESGLVRFDGTRLRLFEPEEAFNGNSRILYMGHFPGTRRLFAFNEAGRFINIKTGVRKQVFFSPPPYFTDSLFNALYKKPIGSHLFNFFDNFGILQKNSPDLLIHVSPDSFYIVTYNRAKFATPKKFLWETPIPETPQMPLYWQGQKLYRRQNGVFFEITKNGLQPGVPIPGFKKIIWNEPEGQTFILSEDQTLSLLKISPDGRFNLLPIARQIPSNFEIVSAYYMPGEQILMLGGAKQGLLVCKKQQFISVGANLPGYNSLQYAVLPYDSHSVVSRQKKIIRDDGSIHPLPSPPPGNEAAFTSMTGLRNGDFIFCEENMVQLHSHEGKLIKKVTVKARISTVYTDRHNRVWLVDAYSGDLYCLDDNLEPRQVKGIGKLPHTFCIREVNDEYLLLGTLKGLYTYSRKTGKLLFFNRTVGYVIRDIFVSVYNRVFLSTYGQGIIAAGPDGFSRLPTDPGKNLNMAHCILRDSYGRLWISSNKGLFEIREFDLYQYLENKRRYLYYRHWLSTAGFGTNEFNGGCQPCGVRLASGEMVFPSMNGLVFFNPETSYAYQPPKTLDIEKITVDEKVVHPIPDTLLLDRAFKRFEIELAAPFFSTEEMPQFEYTPDTNQAASWTPIGPDSKISFTSTESGYSYVAFRQHRVNGLGSYTYRTLVLYKAKAFWELPIFWFACLVILIFLILGAVRFRTRTLKQRNDSLAEAIHQAREELLVTINSLTETTQKLEQKTRFQRWLTSSLVHDLRGPLRFVNFYGGEIKKDSDITPEQNKFLKSVYFSVLKIYTYSENLVQLLKVEQTLDFPPEKTDFVSLVEDKMEQFREQAKWSNTQLLLEPDSASFIWVNRAALSIIVQNLLDNSIKNSKNGSIHISLSNDGGQSRIFIRDEGPGIPADILDMFNRPFRNELSYGQEMGIGLWLVKSLMAQTKGEIRFENVQPKGLLITLCWFGETAS